MKAPVPKPTISVALELITPLAGHTATKTAGQSASAVHAREASVAAMIRRWWRMCYAGRYSTTEELFAEEARRFGAAGMAGKVRVQAATTKTGQLFEVPDRRNNEGKVVGRAWPGDWAQYALFPWESVPRPKFTRSMSFTVEITAPREFQEELEVALGAWVHVGGLGQRARRGMGSLRCTDNSVMSLPEVLGKTAGSGPALATTMPPAENVLVKTTETFATALTAWQESVDKMYRYFRQGEGFARPRRSSPRGRPGQSYFPEPDSIRRWSDTWDHPEHIEFDGFPRADLGLPIIFEIKAARGIAVPPKSELNTAAQGRTRFASPVITKAWWDADTRQFRPLTALLSAPHAWEGGPLQLRSATGSPEARPVSPQEVQLSRAEREQIWETEEPIREAFLTLCKESGYSPIKGSSS